MSWVKKRGPGVPATTAPTPPVQMYNPNQHSNQENQWQQPQNYWPQPYNQQYQEYYQNNPPSNIQYNQGPQQGDAGTWGSNWNWGDEDNSNIQSSTTNTLADSFANDESWNWSVEDPSKTDTTKRNKLETPQWSVESQVSQESSDDVLQTSESDRMLSRSSTEENKEIIPKAQLNFVPDNSEQPDPPRKFTQPENLEAPINDRDQYLETAQLSDVDAYAARDVVGPVENDAMPPPGLRRMVPGEAPEGLRRMIPGESSPPEVVQTTSDFGEVERRAETIIGADTSPEGRREEVEGGKDDVGDLVAGVRGLRVEEEEGRRRESSGSENEKERDRNRSRYSPDEYRERKYDRRRHNKERRYEEDTDYYSDKERERRRRDDQRDYDKKYNSLRKEKEKDRRRKEYGRERDRNYYRYEDEYENESRSRASSRSDSYRERDRRDRRYREKERDRHRRHRDPFNPYGSGFGYDMYTQYYQQYHYYENLRKTNPQAYAQLYRKYYQDMSGATEDRASVHSGRSSANDELAKDRYTRQSYYSQTSLPHLGGYYRGGSQTQSISGQYGLDDSSFAKTLDHTDADDSQLNPQRLTPAKFATAHIKASIASGKIVKILPHYPLDGQTPTVELCNFETLLANDENYQELKRFPGPLVKGTTHKKTIIEYCENKILQASRTEINDKDSYILMWELLILLIRQNGMVVGADIAELLLKNCEQERPPSVVSTVSSHAETENEQNLKEEEVTNRFREYLLYGSGKEALEWAMKHGLWGHALFLASKLDKRTYANVMMRFANGLTMNDPLQTLYQLLSGRTPAAVTCVADEKWGDWRPHLAMILSNSTQRPELNCKAITTLGDTLMGRGSLYAAQFCYLMAEVGFSHYNESDAKLVLLGSNHNNTFIQFATNDAIHMTEIYEYARSLNDDEFGLVNFQYFKFILSTRLADVGLLEKSLAYLERIAGFIVKNRTIDKTLVNDVTNLADRLKYNDPIGDGDVDLDSSRVENSWLKDLRKIQEGEYDLAPQENQEVWQQQYEQQWNTENQQKQESNQLVEQQYWPGQQWTEPIPYLKDPNEQANYFNSLAPSEEISHQTPSQISLPNQYEENNFKAEEEEEKKEVVPPKVAKPDVGPEINKSGWFGGIFNKLSLKPKNQMKLPDDKNPTILWDSDKKRWINTDGENADEGSNFKPPPKMTELHKPIMPQIPKVEHTQVQENGNVVKTSQPNMFKLQRNRNLKKSYIDVFNPSGQANQVTVAPGAPLQQQPPMNFFVPQPNTDPNAPVDFLTPAPTYEENTQVPQ